MKYSIIKAHGSPAYLQLYRQLKHDIIAGVLTTGTKLPSKRLMADELGISIITVEHTYSLLLDEGYISSAQRSGYYVAFGETHSADASHPMDLPEEIIDPDPLPAAPDTPFSPIAKAMRRVLAECDSRLLKKSDNCGCPELRSAISGYLLRSRGINVGPERIIIGSGAEYLYGIIVQLLGRDKLYALEDPCYETIRLVYEANGACCVGLPLGKDGIKSSALARCDAGILHVTPYNSFPSGVTAPASKRHQYAAWAAEDERYIVEDDYDSELSSAHKQIDTIYSLIPEKTIYLNTFSRTIAPSFRTGYMILPPELHRRYIERLNFYSCTVPIFDQYVLAEFINSGEFERNINRKRRILRKTQPEQNN